VAKFSFSLGLLLIFCIMWQTFCWLTFSILVDFGYILSDKSVFIFNASFLPGGCYLNFYIAWGGPAPNSPGVFYYRLLRSVSDTENCSSILNLRKPFRPDGPFSPDKDAARNRLNCATSHWRKPCRVKTGRNVSACHRPIPMPMRTAKPHALFRARAASHPEYRCARLCEPKPAYP
jgi:hypothetical protein